MLRLILEYSAAVAMDAQLAKLEAYWGGSGAAKAACEMSDAKETKTESASLAASKVRRPCQPLMAHRGG
jgi:hypothetical protein